jgi:hypothetical protein
VSRWSNSTGSDLYSLIELLQDTFRVSEGTRTPDRLDHNQELYQLSYAHHGLRTRV